MSSYASNSSLARTRSLRTSAKPTLTAPQTSTSSINKSPQVPTCTSNVLLFLTNSRLLDLDLEPDWPDITPTTFSSKDAVGGQKKRIQCVEWALYQLFSLWDHDDAHNKLRPFYPPADQIQSINLRAALVRSLEAAKKNGVLGRDVLIRKTMLDECKGERLEEVLAVFSSAVLKKLVAERSFNSGPEYRPTTSEAISLENWGYTGDRTELNGLLLAHKASLKSILAKKNAAREKYRNFEELLAMKERQIARRREQAKFSVQDGSRQLSDTAQTEVRRILRNNWAGNEQWVDGLLGGSSFQRDGLLSTAFDDVWGGVQAGNIMGLEEQTAGLLEQLERRVCRQKSRLQKWEDFRKSTFGDSQPRVTRDSPPKEKKIKTGFEFRAHLNLDYHELEGSSDISFDDQPPAYPKLLNELTTKLESLNTMKIPDFSSLITSTRRGPASTTSSQFVLQEPAPDPVSDLSDWEDEPDERTPQLKAGDPSTDGGVHPTAIPRKFAGSQGQQFAPRENRKASPKRHEDQAEGHRRTKLDPSATRVGHKPPNAVEESKFKLTSENEETQTAYSRPKYSRSATGMDDTVDLHFRPKSPTQALADEILNSMNNASPSPMKKSRYTLSLAERTRMSMTRTTFEPEDETPHLSPVKLNYTQEDSVPTKNHDLERGEEYDDLITRTRRSMAGFEAARQKAQLERRRSQRKSKITQRKDSYFPRVDEESVGDLSVVEGLMEDEQEDYEAIFKSRPRIATSPAPSPARHWNEEE
ncbi:hypothetical protein NUW58_g7527 [Xylaria curta]|uniref:Uncharacterized protein n=1 Tax=Xylaria curta TaxID=42375 RepID=A0ACC1NH19_9PEZI|nr:hypothetical protein NUW58_g7527 [Xylaria curta]